jgi:hypothetical protein
MNKTKIILFAAILAIASAAIFSYVFLDNNFLIRQWHFPLDPPGFRDAQQIGVAAESYAKGNDPLKGNVFTSEGYQGLNYPRIWHILFVMGIKKTHTNLIGLIFALLFFIGIGMFWFANEFDNITYILLSIFILSPPAMLAVERGNVETVMFFVLSAALLMNYYSGTCAFVLFMFASILKLYPVFSFAYILKEPRKKFWNLLVLIFVIFSGYVLLTLDDIRQMYLIQPQHAKSSFGLNVFWKGLTHPRIFNFHLNADILNLIKLLPYALLALIFIGALTLSMRNYFSKRYRPGEHIDAFRVGAGIYIGCFLIGNHLDYRLIFLIFTVPQLLVWLKNEENRVSSAPLATLLALIMSLWSFFISRFIGLKITFILEEFANWAILALLIYLFFSSLPEWLNADLRLLFNKTSGKTS